MKYVVLLLVALFMFGCGDDPQSMGSIEYVDVLKPEPKKPEVTVIENKNPKPFKKIKRATIRWDIKTNCGKVPGIPKVMFYDQQSGETFGPYDMNTAKKTIKIYCREGNELCWGAWMGCGNYYDCNKADETGYCFHVKWNPGCYTWSCGKDCSKYGVPDWYCPSCYDRDYSKNIFLSCGDYYNK